MKAQLDGDKDGAKAAAAEGQSNTMTMMMAMMQQNQQMVLALLTKPKEEDPLMKILLAKLLDGGSMGGGGAAPPPPPPPAKTEGLGEILTGIAAFMQATSPSSGGDDDYKELLKSLLLQKMQGEGTLAGLSLKDILELVKGGGGKGDFQATFDNMALMMNMAQTLRQSTEPGAAAGFFDALAALFGNRDFAGSIAQSIRGKLEGKTASAEERLKAREQRLQMEGRILQKKQMELATSTQQASQPPPPRQQPVQQVQQPAQQAARPQPVTEQTQREAEAATEQTRKIPPLPANTYEHLNGIVGAKDEGEQVGKVVGMLIYFAEFDGWRVYVERILGLVRDGHKVEALRLMRPLFEGLSHAGMLTAEAVEQVVVAFENHFSTVQEHLNELSLAKDAEMLVAPTTAPPA